MKASSGNRSQERLEFLYRNRGTFAEIVGESDLQTVNSALRLLFSLLREASQQFHQEGDGGRFGAFTALGACWQFISLFKEPHAENLEAPIIWLMSALYALDHNRVEKIVDPITHRGGGPSSPAHSVAKGYAAAAVRLLMQAGFDRKEAHRAVGKVLDSCGVRTERGSRKVTATTVRNWCNEVSRDVGRHGVAALSYDEMLRKEQQQSFHVLAKSEAMKFVLGRLAGRISSMIPGGSKAT
jgi:hypothetical protein